jgi:molybdenum cofactor biosynthesis enzyme MoaA
MAFYLVKKYAADLKKAGLKQVNLSLDAIDFFNKINGRGAA